MVTNMNDLTNLRVFIEPVGYEIERIVEPPKRQKADRVWLMIHENRSQDRAEHFTEENQRRLEDAGIEVRLKYHDRHNLFKIIKAVKEVLEEERENSIYVNTASGSKIQAIGAMMACMMFGSDKNVTPFYAEAENYPSVEIENAPSGITRVDAIPQYLIHIPEEKHVRALRLIRAKGRISKKEMAELAEAEGLITVNADNPAQARFASLDKRIIGPLEQEWHFIKVIKKGRTRYIEITEAGENAAEFLI